MLKFDGQLSNRIIIIKLSKIALSWLKNVAVWRVASFLRNLSKLYHGLDW